MLSDDELRRLRDGFIAASGRLYHEGDLCDREVWGEVVFDPCPRTIHELLSYTVGTKWHAGIADAVLEVGIAVSTEVLNGVPLPVRQVPDRRWQLQRELASVCEQLSLEALQQLVYRARALS